MSTLHGSDILGGVHSTTKLDLLPQHLDDLRHSGLSEEQIRKCGFRSSTDPRQIGTWLGWKNSAALLGPCLCIPFSDANGKPLNYVRVKPDKPRTSKTNGKRIKYESPVGMSNRAYIPPGTRTVLADPSRPLIVTEGEKKAAKADQDGFPCIGLAGVYGWQKKRTQNKFGRSAGPRELVPDLTDVLWNGRTVYIAYDSDLAEKREVRVAEWHLSEALREAGATVFAVRIPSGSGEKQGLDDFLVAAGAVGLRGLMEAATPVTKPKRVPPADSVPEIRIGTDEYRVNEEACSALGNEANVYQHGGMLVQIVEREAESENPIARQPGYSASIDAILQPLVRECLTRCARWTRLVTKNGEEEVVPTHPPEWAVKAILARRKWQSVRKLTAVVTHPVILPDGSILSRNGYDRATGLFISIPDGLTVNVPERPTTRDVTAAVEELGDVVRDFPFENEMHRSAWLASLLTPLAWFAFRGPAPMFLIDGNIRGVGKGLLADVVALIVTGQRFPVTNYTNDKEEMRKQITTSAAEGERLILLDNLVGLVGNAVLEAALTTESWRDRLLGGNKKYVGPLNVAWFATGNNVQFTGDLDRRVCHIRVETPEESPEMKEGFRYPNLRDHVLEMRGKLLAAALTILRAWIVAGMPDCRLRAWGSYESWSQMVRGAIVFAGQRDPGETRLQFQATADRDARAMTDIISGLAEMDEERRGLTTSEIVARLNANESPSAALANMREAIVDLCGKFCGRSLGYKFRSFTRRNFRGRMIDKAGESGVGSNKWIVVSANSERRRVETSPASPSSPVRDETSTPHLPERVERSPASPSSPVPENTESGDEGDTGDVSAQEHDGKLFDNPHPVITH